MIRTEAEIIKILGIWHVVGGGANYKVVDKWCREMYGEPFVLSPLRYCDTTGVALYFSYCPECETREESTWDFAEVKGFFQRIFLFKNERDAVEAKLRFG